MKIKILAALMIVGILGLGVFGCKSNTTPSAVPPLNPGSQGRLVEVSYDDFQAQKHISQEIELNYPESLVVSLANNHSTGFQWSQNATISDAGVLSQYEHNVVPPSNSVPGAPGKDVWTFKALKTGTATISMSYSQPWQGGTQNEWTFTLKVTVK